MDEHWMDVLSEVPLARSVPVFSVATGQFCVVMRPAATDRGAPQLWWVVGRYTHRVGTTTAAEVRVNLDDPQGMAYALRRLWRHVGLEFSPVMERHLMAKTTYADRLAVARALSVHDLTREPNR